MKHVLQDLCEIVSRIPKPTEAEQRDEQVNTEWRIYVHLEGLIMFQRRSEGTFQQIVIHTSRMNNDNLEDGVVSILENGIGKNYEFPGVKEMVESLVESLKKN